MTASLRSKTQNSSSKSQKKKPDAEMRRIVPQPSRQPLPMKPRRGLFMTLMTIFVAWVGVMVGMYVTTVRPRRHSAPPSQQPQPAATAPSLAGQASSAMSLE